jgi:HCOMODA/2-hydroxy-3-carboxy-muconic semialdehyde decarboxylase
MTDIPGHIEDLVTANRILAHERVLDSFGHVSIRDPGRAGVYLMSRARAPGLVEAGDIMAFSLTGENVGSSPGKPYSERFIHGAVYEARPDVMSVVHSHGPSVVPFTVVARPMRPLMHLCAPIGDNIPNWDIAARFGDATNMLVTGIDMARDLARVLGRETMALMRGHGCVVTGSSLRDAVFTSVYMEMNADMQIKAMAMGEVTYLSAGEIAAVRSGRAGFTLERAWEDWCARVGRRYIPGAWDYGTGFSRTDR